MPWWTALIPYVLQLFQQPARAPQVSVPAVPQYKWPELPESERRRMEEEATGVRSKLAEQMADTLAAQRRILGQQYARRGMLSSGALGEAQAGLTQQTNRALIDAMRNYAQMQSGQAQAYRQAAGEWPLRAWQAQYGIAPWQEQYAYDIARQGAAGRSAMWGDINRTILELLKLYYRPKTPVEPQYPAMYRVGGFPGFQGAD